MPPLTTPSARRGPSARLALGLAAALAACGPPAARAEMVGIRVGTQAEALLPFYVAVDSGLFAAAGLEVHEAPYGSGAAMLMPLLEGRIDLAYMALAPAVVLWTRGVPVEVLLLSHVSTSERLVARPGAGIARLADLRGKRVAVGLGTTAHLALVRALQRAGIAPDQITIVHMLAPQMPRAFSAAEVDAAWAWEPTSGALEEQGGVTVATSADVLGLPSAGVWLARRDFVRDHPEAVARFLAGIDHGVAAYLADRDAAVAAAARRLGRSPEAVAAYVRRAGLRYPTLAEQGGPAWIGPPGATAETPLVAFARATAGHFHAARILPSTPADWSSFVNEAPLGAFLHGALD